MPLARRRQLSQLVQGRACSFTLVSSHGARCALVDGHGLCAAVVAGAEAVECAPRLLRGPCGLKVNRHF